MDKKKRQAMRKIRRKAISLQNMSSTILPMTEALKRVGKEDDA